MVQCSGLLNRRLSNGTASSNSPPHARTKQNRNQKLYRTLPPQKRQIMFLLAGGEASQCRIYFSPGRGPKRAGPIVWAHAHFPNPEISMTSMNQEERVAWQHFANTQEAIKYAKEQGYVVIAIELCQEAKPYHKFEYPQKVCFVLGHENSGVHQEILSICDSAVYIPYFGKNYSLNVAVSAAIVAFRRYYKDHWNSQMRFRLIHCASLAGSGLRCYLLNSYMVSGKEGNPMYIGSPPLLVNPPARNVKKIRANLPYLGKQHSTEGGILIH